MSLKQIIQPDIQDGKSIDHPIVLLTLGKPVLPHRGRGNPAVLTSSSTYPSPIGRNNGLPHQGRGRHAVLTSSLASPSSIWSTLTSSSNMTPKQVFGTPSTLSHSSMSSAVSTTPPSKNQQIRFTPPQRLAQTHPCRSPPRKSLNSPHNQINAQKKQAFLLNFCDRDEVKIECLKYLKHAADLPINQENQLTFLLDQFQVRDIQASFYKLIGEVGGVASSAFTPMS
jgi:hypothetical protein